MRTSTRFAIALAVAMFNLAFFAGAPARAAAVWDNGGTGNDFFNDANWNPDTVVNPGTPVGMDLTLNATDIANVGHVQIVSIGIGSTLELNDATVSISGAGGVFLPTGAAVDAAGNQTITLNGNSALAYFWGWDNTWQINATSSVVMGNTNTNADTGGLGKDSTVDFGGFGGMMHLTQINLTEFTAAWQAKFTVNGLAAVWGADPTVNEMGDTILVTSDGGSGVFINPIPAPAALPAGLALLVAVAARRHRSA